MCFSLGLQVNIHSNYFNTIKNEYKNYKSLNFENIIKNCDIISFHCKPNKENKPFLDKNNLKYMKKSAFIINTARGNLINEIDLKEALENNIITGAALDVFSDEPAKNNPLFGVKNVILTPHIAASTNEAQVIVAEMIAEQVTNFFLKKEIKNSV